MCGYYGQHQHLYIKVLNYQGKVRDGPDQEEEPLNNMQAIQDELMTANLRLRTIQRTMISIAGYAEETDLEEIRAVAVRQAQQTLRINNRSQQDKYSCDCLQCCCFQRSQKDSKETCLCRDGGCFGLFQRTNEDDACCTCWGWCKCQLCYCKPSCKNCSLKRCIDCLWCDKDKCPSILSGLLFIAIACIVYVLESSQPCQSNK